MKKILWFVLPLLAFSLTACEENNVEPEVGTEIENEGGEQSGGEELTGDDIIPFNDEGFLKVLLHKYDTVRYGCEIKMNIDTNGDEKISVNEAAAVKNLYVSEYIINSSEKIADISDMSGIEYFTGLDSLFMRYVALETLDLSKNTTLKRIDCTGCDIKNLILGNNTAFEELEADRSGLVTLDVSQCPALKELFCGVCNLTTLTLGDNPALTRLLCYENELVSLNLSGCTALEDLDCSDNKLGSLDISKNTNLESISLERNPFTSITVNQDQKNKIEADPDWIYLAGAQVDFVVAQ